MAEVPKPELFANEIRINLPKLIEHTTCTDKLLNMCLSERILTDWEYQELVSLHHAVLQ